MPCACSTRNWPKYSQGPPILSLTHNPLPTPDGLTVRQDSDEGEDEEAKGNIRTPEGEAEVILHLYPELEEALSKKGDQCLGRNQNPQLVN